MEFLREISLGLVVLALIMAVGAAASPSFSSEEAGLELATIEQSHGVGRAANCTLADQLVSTVSVTLSPGWYQYHYIQLSADVGLYGDFDVDGGMQIKFFICDQANFDLWTDGYTASVYLRNAGVSSLEWAFRVPRTDTWYILYSNEYYLYSSVHVAGHHYIDTTPPAIDWNIDDGATYSGTKEITATITEAKFDIESVRLYIDGNLVDTEYDGSFSYSWDTAGEDDGSHTIRIEAADTVGNEGFLSVQVSVNNFGQYIPIITLASVGVIALVVVGVVFRKRSQAPAQASAAPVEYTPSGPEIASEQSAQAQPQSTSQPTPPPHPFPQPKFCPYCGKPLVLTGVRFCPECGSPLGQ